MKSIQVAAATANILGECPLWESRSQSLWWTDIQASKLYCQCASEGLQVWSLPERLCAFGFTQTPGRLIAAFASGFAYYTPAQDHLQWLHRIDTANQAIRLNDGRCDRFGRFIVGGLVEVQGDKQAELFQLQPSGRVATLLQGIDIANSICWSHDNNTFYFADSTEQTIWAFDYHGDDGSISNRRIFAQTSGQCFPDGSTVDAAGFLWNAQWGASRVVRYAPDGGIDQIIELPVSQPSCVAFGGPDLDQLYITTARQELSEQQLQQQPLAGQLLVTQTPYRGLAEAVFDDTNAAIFNPTN